jgi:ComF family protein
MLDWLFTPSCAACHAVSADPLCEPCSASLDELGPACPHCAEPTAGRTCSRCAAGKLPIERIVSPWRFGGQLAVAIRRLKLAGHTHVARTLAPLWAPLLAAAASGEGAENTAMIVPVPTHWRRRFTRGFDHVWLLALHACRAAELPPPVPALRRVRHAPPQSTLAAAARRSNLRDAFAVCRPVCGRSIVLVDDVATTGTTLAECARALTAAGATSVVGVVLARS